MSELLGIYVKTLDDSVFQFYQTGLILNSLLDSCFVVRKVYPYMCMSKTVICVVFVDNFLFWQVHNMILIM